MSYTCCMMQGIKELSVTIFENKVLINSNVYYSDAIWLSMRVTFLE